MVRELAGNSVSNDNADVLPERGVAAIPVGIS
jgi:hypothetical protein